jgi:fumarate hydratase subunit beta
MKEIKFSRTNLGRHTALMKYIDPVWKARTIYTARDAAHKKIAELINSNKTLPFELTNAIIYYAGPTPAKNGLAVGSIGPTTSSRMDKFAPLLMENGLKAMVGKGGRSTEVVSSIVKNGAVYFAAIGGAGALYSGAITECEVIAFPELGCESVKKLTVKDFPLIVAVDSTGASLFER